MPSLIQSYHQNIKQFLTTSAEELARETQFVQRKSKIGGSAFLQGLMWSVYLFGKITLTGFGSLIEKLHPGVCISDQGLAQRFNPRAVAFLKAMFALALRLTLGFPAQSPPVLSVFGAVYLLDSTSVALPDRLAAVFKGCGGSGPQAAAKVYLLLDWLKGSCEAVRLENGSQPDQNMGRHFLPGKAKGALWLFDLGFWNLAFFKAIVAQGSYFLARLQAQVTLSAREMGSIVRLDLDFLLSQVDSWTAIFELDVLLGPDRDIASRLICKRLPPEVADERRRKAKKAAKRQGKTLSQRALKRLDWGLYVTNAPKSWLATEAIEVVYHIRWQVELTFKLSKTDAALDKTNSEREERVLCEFYAKLISLCFFHALMALFNGRIALSYPKAWRRLQDDLIDLGKALRRGRGLAELKALLAYLESHARKSKRKKYPSTLQKVLDAQQRLDIRQMVEPIAFIKAQADGRNQSFPSFVRDYCAIPERQAA